MQSKYETSELARSLLRASTDALLDPQALLEAVRDSTGQVIDFVYRELNQATCDHLGLARADLIGRGIVETMPGIGQTNLLAGYARCLNTGEPLILDDFSYNIFSYNNEILLDTRRYDLRATRATATSIVITWRDVTERFQLAQRVSESEARLRLLIDTATIAMNVSGPDGKLESVNDAMCELFGYDAETLTQMTWQDLAAPEYLDADMANFDAISAGQIDSYRMTMEFIHADGRRFWGNLSVSCVRLPNGDVDQFAAQIIDITSEVELAQRLKVHADRLAADLHSAANYVASILPGDMDGPVHVSSRYLPSRELAGDIFDHRWVDDDHLIVYLIDVSGHGIEAALLSVSVHNMLRCGLLPLATLLSPEQVLSELNRRFQMDQHGEHYFTMWFGVYEAPTRTLRYASAGAPPAFALESTSANNITAAELSTSGAPVGMFSDTVFTSRDYPVPPGCRILLYSDGAYEIDFDDGRQLSPADFKDVVIQLTGSSNSFLDDLVAELRGLTPDGTFEDDCSLVQLVFD